MKWYNLNERNPPEHKMVLIGVYNHHTKTVDVCNMGYFTHDKDHWLVGGSEQEQKYWKKDFYILWAKA